MKNGLYMARHQIPVDTMQLFWLIVVYFCLEDTMG